MASKKFRSWLDRLPLTAPVSALALVAVTALIVAVDPIAAQEFGGGGGTGDGDMLTLGTSFLEWMMPRGMLLLIVVAVVTHFIGDAKSVEDDKKFLQWRNKAILGIPIAVGLVLLANLFLVTFGYDPIDIIPNFSV